MAQNAEVNGDKIRAQGLERSKMARKWRENGGKCGANDHDACVTAPLCVQRHHASFPFLVSLRSFRGSRGSGRRWVPSTCHTSFHCASGSIRSASASQRWTIGTRVGRWIAVATYARRRCSSVAMNATVRCSSYHPAARWWSVAPVVCASRVQKAGRRVAIGNRSRPDRPHARRHDHLRAARRPPSPHA
jgi:hypothetical protein